MSGFTDAFGKESKACEFQTPQWGVTRSCLCKKEVQTRIWLGSVCLMTILFFLPFFFFFVGGRVKLKWPHVAVCHKNFLAALWWSVLLWASEIDFWGSKTPNFSPTDNTIYENAKLCFSSWGDLRRYRGGCVCINIWWVLYGLGYAETCVAIMWTYIFELPSAVTAWQRAECSRCSRGPIQQIIKIIWNINVLVAVSYLKRVCKCT